MSVVNGFQVGSETLKYNYESLENYNTPNFSSSSSKAYAIGDYVIYNGKLYKCITATTGGTWDANNWTEAILSDDVTDAKNALSALDANVTDPTNSITYPAVSAMFESGSFNSTGAEVSTNITIRSKLNYYYCTDNVARVSCDTGYVIGIRAWRRHASSSTYVGFYHEDGTFSDSGTQKWATEFDLTRYPDYYFRFVFAHSDLTTTMSVSDAVHFHFRKVFYGLNEVQELLVNNEINGKRAINYYLGTISKQSNGIVRYDECTNSRAFTNVIPVSAGDTIRVTANGYKYFILYFVGEQYDASNIQSLPATLWQTTTLEYVFHSNVKVIVRFARSDDDTANIDINDLKAKADVSVSTFAARADHRLYGKKLSIMGDSISTYEGYIPSGALSYYPAGDVTSVQKTYWQYLASQEGMIIDTVNAYGGTTVATKWQTTDRPEMTSEGRLSNLGNPDFIVVFGGVNDYGGNPLGDYPVDGTYTNMFEFRTAYAYLLDQLKQRYPSARIICLTILNSSGYSASGIYPLKQKEIRQALATDLTLHYMYEFNESIIELAKRYNCTVCDISDCMNYYNSSESIDGTHPKEVVHDRIAYKLRETLLGM